MNREQYARLCDAVKNLGDLIDDVEWLIDLLSGTAGRIEREEAHMPKKITKVDLPEDKTKQLTRWYELKNQIAVMQNEEVQLRQKLVMDNFTATKLEGTESIDVWPGWRLRATKDMNITATNESHQTEALLQTLGEIDPEIAGTLVKWKPDVAKVAYRKLLELADANPPLKTLIAAAITAKPGLPQLELVKIEEKPAEAPPVYQVESGKVFTDGADIEY